MASPTKRTTRTTQSGRARGSEGKRRAKGQTESARGTAGGENQAPRKRSPKAGSSS